MFKEKARQFAPDSKIQSLLADIYGVDQSFGGLLGIGFSQEKADLLKTTEFGLEKNG